MPASYTSPGPYTETGLQRLGRALVCIGVRKLALGVLGFLLPAAALMVAPGRSRAEDVAPPLHLPFAGKAPTRAVLSEDRREVVLSFVGEVNEAAVKQAASAAGDLLEGYTTGYGAVRLRFTRPVQATLAGGNALDVQPDAPVADPAEARRLAMLEMQVLARSDPRQASVKLQDALRDRPNDLDLLLALAGVQDRAGDWQGGLRSYDRALTLAPDAADIAQQREALARQYGPTLHVDTSAVFGPGERDQLANFSADVPLAPGWRGFATALAQHSTLKGLRRSGSDVATPFDASKLQGQVGLQRDWTPAISTKVDLTAAPQSFGAGVNQTLVSRYGTTALIANYHTPYWETLTSFAANAHRDSVGLLHSVAIGAWQLAAGVSGLRYGLPRASDVATGAGLDGSVTRTLPAAWLPAGVRVDAGYRLDAEYLGHVKAVPSGESAAVLPLLDVRTREVHTLEATGQAAIGPGVLTAVAGYSVDRFGGSGPEAVVRYARADDGDSPLVFGIEAGTNPSLDFNTRQLYRVGAFATWRLGMPRTAPVAP